VAASLAKQSALFLTWQHHSRDHGHRQITLSYALLQIATARGELL